MVFEQKMPYTGFMNTTQIADILGYGAAGIGIVMFLPQVIQCWKTKNTKAVSALSFLLLATSAALWTIYGILLKAYPIILVNSVITVLSLFILILKRKYG